MFKIDARDFERMGRQFGASAGNVQYALSLSLNDGAKKTRKHLIDKTWPSGVTVRNGRFLGWALRTEFASKGQLRITIHDERANGRGHLALHADGGTKGAKGRLAIPPGGSTAAAARGAKGVPKPLRPSAIIAKTPKRALRITTKGIFVGSGGKLHMEYNFQPSANQPADVPFRDDFATEMVRHMRASFGPSLRRAMRPKGGKR